jgi:hypothetical protein
MKKGVQTCTRMAQNVEKLFEKKETDTSGNEYKKNCHCTKKMYDDKVKEFNKYKKSIHEVMSGQSS